jgi:light-independent protochlorophyllide reductase subunit B
MFDTWVHPLVMGLEEHLLTMFRDDFEFNDSAVASHLAEESGSSERPQVPDVAVVDGLRWAQAAEKELKKIPFFVRGKAKRNTELFAVEQGLNTIEVETLYEAKAHFSR